MVENSTMSSDVKDKAIKEQSQLVHTEVSREALIETAIKFLLNPKVKNSPVSQKRMFLESKGLTPSEIAAALEKSGVANEVFQMPSSEFRPFPYSHAGQPPIKMSKWTKLRDFCNSTVFICGTVYGLYHFSKKYILPYMFGFPSEEEKISRIENEMKDFQATTAKSFLQLQSTLQDLQVSLQKLNEKQDTSSQAIPKNMETQFTDLHSEITSLKGLLLNRHQFPAAPTVSPIIPTWQMRNTVEANGDIGNDDQMNLIAEPNVDDATENAIPSV